MLLPQLGSVATFPVRQLAAGAVGEREKFVISGLYYTLVTGELAKANQSNEQFSQTYPTDWAPPFALALNYAVLGQYDKALPENIESLRLDPDSVFTYVNLMGDYAALNRLDEAKATYEQALARKLETPGIHANRYAVAFLEGDAADMQRQLDWAAGKPGAEDLLLSVHSDTEAYAGCLEKARELSRQAADSANRSDQKETAALWLLNAALREAEVGNPLRAREQVPAALALASSRNLQTLAALVLARAETQLGLRVWPMTWTKARR